MKETDKYTDRDWEELAARFSGEMAEARDSLNDFSADDELNTGKIWKELGMTSSRKEINVDNAWDNLYGRIRDNGLLAKTATIGQRRLPVLFLRIAAAALIFIGLGTAVLYLTRSGFFRDEIVVASNSTERNIEVTLPDGSKVWLNRNSQLSYNPAFSKGTRNVKLKGEAYFEITPDASKPFLIESRNGSVKVLGTSFNVITSNSQNEIEVFVKTGKVMLSDATGTSNMVLEPGEIGTFVTGSARRSVNENQNYIAWKTDTLVYDGQTLDIVFADLKRVFDINITTDDPGILNNSIATTFFSLPQDTIIQVICNTFNFRYEKDGSGYHLTK